MSSSSLRAALMTPTTSSSSFHLFNLRHQKDYYYYSKISMAPVHEPKMQEGGTETPRFFTRGEGSTAEPDADKISKWSSTPSKVVSLAP